jgi:light-regulated signal transduction histidine kinase (bacteriophytochrome)
MAGLSPGPNETPPVSAADLQNCAREPIHIPSAIQPHGLLLTFEEETQKILQVSANCATLIGIDAEGLLGQTLGDLLDTKPAEAVRSALRSDPPESPIPLHIGPRQLDGLLHRTDGVVVLELEPAPPTEAAISSACITRSRGSSPGCRPRKISPHFATPQLIRWRN